MLICQLSDLHVRPPGLMANGVVDATRLTERALKHVAATRPAPDCVVITGDLTDCGLPAEYAVLRALLRQTLRMPCYLLPGNHDRRENFLAAFAGYPGIGVRDGRVNYVIDSHEMRIICLDSVVPGAGHGELGPATLSFLDQTLAASTRPAVIALHHPPFLCGMTFADSIALRDRDAMRAVVARHPQVRRVIAGHHHRALVAPFAHAIATVAPSVAHQATFDLEPAAPSTLNLEPPGYQLHRVGADDTICTHTVLVGPFPGPFVHMLDPDYPGQRGPDPA